MAPANQVKKGKQPVKENPLETIAKQLRSSKGPEVRDAVIENRRVDFFRAKDYMQYCKENPAIFDVLPAQVLSTAKRPDDRAELLMRILLRHGLCFRCDRLNKKPPPGKKKLLKWPKKLIPHPQNEYDEDGFYAWIFEAPGTKWIEGIGSLVLVVLVIGCCLFPLSPHWLKLGVLYTCLSLLGLIFFISVVRGIIFSLVWVVVGRHFWVLPNLFSDEVGVLDAFAPLYGFDEPPPPKEGEEPKEPEEPPSIGSRLAVCLGIICTVYSLYTYSPDTEELALNAKQAHKSILEMLDLYEAPAALGDNNTSTEMANATLGVNSTDWEGVVWTSEDAASAVEKEQNEEDMTSSHMDELVAEAELEATESAEDGRMVEDM